MINRPFSIANCKKLPEGSSTIKNWGLNGTWMGGNTWQFQMKVEIYTVTVPRCSMVLVYLPSRTGWFLGHMLVNIPAPWSIWAPNSPDSLGVALVGWPFGKRIRRKSAKIEEQNSKEWVHILSCILSYIYIVYIYISILYYMYITIYIYIITCLVELFGELGRHSCH